MKVIFHEDFYRVYTSDPAAAAGRMEAIVEEIETHAETVSELPQIKAEAEELDIVDGAKRRQNQEPVVSDDYGLVTLET